MKQETINMILNTIREDVQNEFYKISMVNEAGENIFFVDAVLDYSKIEDHNLCEQYINICSGPDDIWDDFEAKFTYLTDKGDYKTDESLLPLTIKTKDYVLNDDMDIVSVKEDIYTYFVLED